MVADIHKLSIKLQKSLKLYKINVIILTCKTFSVNILDFSSISMLHLCIYNTQ